MHWENAETTAEETRGSGHQDTSITSGAASCLVKLDTILVSPQDAANHAKSLCVCASRTTRWANRTSQAWTLRVCAVPSWLCKWHLHQKAWQKLPVEVQKQPLMQHQLRTFLINTKRKLNGSAVRCLVCQFVFIKWGPHVGQVPCQEEGRHFAKVKTKQMDIGRRQSQSPESVAQMSESRTAHDRFSHHCTPAGEAGRPW